MSSWGEKVHDGGTQFWDVLGYFIDGEQFLERVGAVEVFSIEK